MKKVIVVDDEPLARQLIREHLGDHSDLEIVAECGDGFEALKAVKQLQPDLLFLDIQMPKISGLEMLEVLEEPPPVIFVTAFDEYAIKAFEAHAVDYLLKPVSKSRFDAALSRWRGGNTQLTAQKVNELTRDSVQGEKLSRIVVREGRDIKIVPITGIYYIEAFDDYVKIFTADTFYLKKHTMNWFAQHLDPAQFVRVHRSFILNISQLTRIESFEKNAYTAILRDGRKVPVSRNSYGELKKILGI